MSEDRNEIIDTDFILLTLPGEEKGSAAIPSSNISDCLEENGSTRIYFKNAATSDDDHKKITVQENLEDIRAQMPEAFAIFSLEDGRYGIPVSNIAGLRKNGNLTRIFIKQCAATGTTTIDQTPAQTLAIIEDAKHNTPRIA